MVQKMFRRWKSAKDLFVRNFTAILVCAVLSVGLEFFEAWRGKSFDPATLIPSIMVAGFVLFAFHVDELTGKSFKTSQLFGRNSNLNKFVWRYIGLVLILVVPVFFGALISGLFGFDRETAEGLVLIVTLALYGVILAFVGTMLPAAAIGGNASLKETARRGGRTF